MFLSLCTPVPYRRELGSESTACLGRTHLRAPRGEPVCVREVSESVACAGRAECAGAWIGVLEGFRPRFRGRRGIGWREGSDKRGERFVKRRTV